MADRFLDSAAFLAALDDQRRALGISWRELCRQAGIYPGYPIAERLAAGNTASVDTFLRLLAWLGETDVTPYVYVLREAR